MFLRTMTSSSELRRRALAVIDNTDLRSILYSLNCFGDNKYVSGLGMLSFEGSVDDVD